MSDNKIKDRKFGRVISPVVPTPSKPRKPAKNFTNSRKREN